MKTRTRRVLVFTLGMIVAWTLAAIVAGELTRPGADDPRILVEGANPASDALGWRLARSLVAGVFSGLVASFLELRIFPRQALRRSVGAMLAARVVIYTVAAFMAVFVTARFVSRVEMGVSLRTLLSNEVFQNFLRGPDFATLVITFVAASFLISAGLQLSRLLGPGALSQIVLGRYVRPTHEDRSFLFVDIADSTGIAEKLGPLRFAEFKNEFFHDIAEPILDARGQIVQYVGDEVMVTWPSVRRGKSVGSDCVRCFFALRQRIDRRADEYKERYGLVPNFRAGLHSGPVVVSQLGDIKREVVFSGDAVNTASRIQGLCRTLGHDFLASSEAVGDAELPAWVAREPLGTHSLRGRETAIDLVALSTA